MPPFTLTDRQAGREEMERTLTPLQRAHRKFLSGRPAARKDTPLGVVLFATEQRERLQNILDAGITGAHIESAWLAVLIHADGSPVDIPDGYTEVSTGNESAAVQYLEALHACGHTFTIAGLAFVVCAGDEKRVFKYQIERTSASEAKLCETADYLIRKMPTLG